MLAQELALASSTLLDHSAFGRTIYTAASAEATILSSLLYDDDSQGSRRNTVTRPQHLRQRVKNKAYIHKKQSAKTIE